MMAASRRAMGAARVVRSRQDLAVRMAQLLQRIRAKSADREVFLRAVLAPALCVLPARLPTLQAAAFAVSAL